MQVVAHRNLDRAIRAHDDLAHLRARAVEHRQELTGADGRVSELLALRVAVDQLHVVVDVAPVLERVQTAQAHHEFGRGAEHPIGHIHLVRGQLRRQTTRHGTVDAPVGDVRLAARLHRPQRAWLVDHVAMPLRVDVVDVPEDPLVHHVLHHLVEVAIAPLQAGLQDLFGMFPRQRA